MESIFRRASTISAEGWAAWVANQRKTERTINIGSIGSRMAANQQEIGMLHQPSAASRIINSI